MIKKAETMKPEITESMRGGKGSVELLKALTNEEMLGKGRLFGKITLKPGTSIGHHQHLGECETYYIIKGEGYVNDNGTDSFVKEGDLVYTKNGESHSIENRGTTDLEFIALILFD